jgi:hypothetical protein
MSTETPLRCVPADIEALFGDPPLLSTEDPARYRDMLDRFAESVPPKNIIVAVGQRHCRSLLGNHSAATL